MKVLTVVGARPQFIKAAPVGDALAAAEGVEHVLVHTGQHFDQSMSDVFFEELSIAKPDVRLNINGGSHGQMTGQMIEALEEVIVEATPDWVLVYGDTNSTLAAAIAASKLSGVRLAHVEAGLRSFNRAMPEEVNRVVTDHLSHLCLTPTATADHNLQAEGIDGTLVVRTGDVMFDAVLRFGALAERRSTVLEEAGVQDGGFVLATVHRAENTDDPRRLRAVIGGLRSLATDVPVVLPMHPRTARAAEQAEMNLDGLIILPPVGYLDMLALERAAQMVVTDSGGVQKEAFFQRRRCVTLRTETEWVELVDLGWNSLVPPVTDAEDVAAGLRAALDSDEGDEATPYGDGDAARRVVDALVQS